MSYTIKNLRDVEDLAVKHGFSEMGEARFAREAIDAEQTGLSYQVVRPGKRQSFGHRHREAEEVYVVLSGSGRVRLDDETVELKPLDALRVGPSVARGFEAGPDGLELLAFGAHRSGDVEMLPDFWER